MVTETTNEMAGVISSWQPKWIVKDKHECECGLTIDDHCFVVLCKDWEDKWKPSTHIPHIIVQRIVELGEKTLLDY